MKQESNDRLKTLFHEIKPARPSQGFESRLMLQIQALEQKRAKRAKILSVGWLAAGVIVFLGLSIGVFYVTGWSYNFKGIDFLSAFKGIALTRDHCLIISVSCVALVLLIGDTLLHKRSREKKYKDE